MAKFFQSFDEERQESSIKTKEIIKRSNEKLSKRETKFKELKEKIVAVENSGKSFEKNFKKLMNDIKKFSIYFENGTIPDFVKDFLEDDRIKSSKPMSILSTEFLTQFLQQKENVNILKKSTKKKSLSFDSILSIEDNKEKEAKLIEYLGNDLDDNEKSEVYITLFSVYSRMKIPVKMIDSLKMVNLALETATVKNLIKNLDAYIGKIADLVKEDDNSVYLDFLNYLKSSTVLAESKVVEKRILEVEYFVLGKCTENEDPLYKLLYLIRQKRWADSYEYFSKNQSIFVDTKPCYLTLIELGRLAACNQEFKASFDILCRTVKSEFYMEIKTELFSLCVILNEKIKDHPFFISFIEEFKHFEDNSLCLPSHNYSIEVFRAFYCLHSLDFINASEIIEKVSGFKAYDILKQQATELQSMY